MGFEELAAQARLEEIRRDIARWERGEAALAEFRGHAGRPKFHLSLPSRPQVLGWRPSRRLTD